MENNNRKMIENLGGSICFKLGDLFINHIHGKVTSLGLQFIFYLIVFYEMFFLEMSIRKYETNKNFLEVGLSLQ